MAKMADHLVYEVWNKGPVNPYDRKNQKGLRKRRVGTVRKDSELAGWLADWASEPRFSRATERESALPQTFRGDARAEGVSLDGFDSRARA